MVLLLALTGMAVVHRAHGRNDAAVDAATEALDLYRLGHSRRFRSRVDPKRDLPVAAAACHVVLAAIAAERDDPEQAATRLGQASRLRAHAGAGLPGFQEDEEQQARTRATDALGADAFTVRVRAGGLGRRGASGLLIGGRSASVALVQRPLRPGSAGTRRLFSVLPQSGRSPAHPAGPAPGESVERIPVPSRSQ